MVSMELTQPGVRALPIVQNSRNKTWCYIFCSLSIYCVKPAVPLFAGFASGVFMYVCALMDSAWCSICF